MLNAVHSDPDSLEQTVILYNQLMQRYALMRSHSLSLSQTDRAELTRMCDQLLGHMLTHFGDCECSQAHVQAIWLSCISEPGPPQRDITVQDLASMPPGVLPVAIMRSVIGHNRMPIQYRDMTHWAQLANRYRHVLR